ncbi:aldehyde dehydrogenase family protein [Nonomuraea rubra]
MVARSSWNFPLLMAAWKLGHQALATRHTVILKPPSRRLCRPLRLPS